MLWYSVTFKTPRNTLTKEKHGPVLIGNDSSVRVVTVQGEKKVFILLETKLDNLMASWWIKSHPVHFSNFAKFACVQII